MKQNEACNAGASSEEEDPLPRKGGPVWSEPRIENEPPRKSRGGFPLYEAAEIASLIGKWIRERGDVSACSLRELSLGTGIPKKALVRFFHSVQDKGIRQWLVRCMVKDFERILLRDEGRSRIKDLARKAGYGSMSNFYALFRKVENCTPGQWRRDNMNCE